MTNLTDKALEGFDADPSASRPYYATSDSGAAWEIGRWLAKRNGGERPKSCRSSRGYTYHFSTITETGKVKVEWRDGRAHITRIT